MALDWIGLDFAFHFWFFRWVFSRIVHAYTLRSLEELMMLGGPSWAGRGVTWGLNQRAVG